MQNKKKDGILVLTIKMILWLPVVVVANIPIILWYGAKEVGFLPFELLAAYVDNLRYKRR